MYRPSWIFCYLSIRPFFILGPRPNDDDDGHDENADDGGDDDEFNCEYRCIVMFVPFALEVGCYCQGLCNSNGAPLSQLMTMMMMAMITMMMMAMVAMMTMITTYNPV